MTDDAWARGQDWFGKRDKVMATEVEKAVDAERERVAAKVARMSPSVVLKVIERLREEPYPYLDREADPRKALAKWIEADNRWKAAQALAEVYETALVERCGPQSDDRA